MFGRKKEVIIYALRREGKYYIGKSNDADRRWKEHGKHDMEIIDRVPESKWKEAETYWIGQYQMTYGVENVLNQTEGGEGGPGFNSGEDHPQATHSNALVEQIKSLALQGHQRKEIAKMTGTNKGYVTNIIKGKRRGKGVDVQGYMDYPEFIEILRDYHENRLTKEDLVKKYNRKPLAIARALQQVHFQTDLYEPVKKRPYTKRTW